MADTLSTSGGPGRLSVLLPKLPDLASSHLTDLLASVRRGGSPSVSDTEDDDGNMSAPPSTTMAMAPYRGNDRVSRTMRRVSSASTLISAMPTRRKTPAVAPMPKLSVRHLEQGVRLANEALEEARTSAATGVQNDYALDCYWSSLDYLCGAFSAPVDSSPNGSLRLDQTRATALRGRLLRVLEKIDGPSGAALAEGNRISAEVGPDGRMEILTTCGHCQSRVAVRVPKHWLPDRPEGYQEGEIPKTWEEAIIASFIWIAMTIKQSPIPGLVEALITYTWATLVALDHRYSLRQRALLAFSSSLAVLMELDRELGVARRFAELLRVLWEASVRGLLAFAKAEGFDPAAAIAAAAAAASAATTAYDVSLAQQRPPTSPGERYSFTSNHSRGSSAVSEYDAGLRTPVEEEPERTPLATPHQEGWRSSLRLR